jgi:ferredoxin
MLANYGYKDASGDFFITIDTDKCNGCGDCVTECPADVFVVVDEDPNDPLREEPVAMVAEEKKKKLKYECNPCIDRRYPVLKHVKQGPFPILGNCIDDSLAFPSSVAPFKRDLRSASTGYCGGRAPGCPALPLFERKSPQCSEKREELHCLTPSCHKWLYQKLDPRSGDSLSPQR